MKANEMHSDECEFYVITDWWQKLMVYDQEIYKRLRNR